MIEPITVNLVAIAGLAVVLGAWLVYAGQLRALTKMAHYAPPATASRHEFSEQLKNVGKCFAYWLGWLLALIPIVICGCILADVMPTPVLIGAVWTLYPAIFAYWLKLWVTTKIKEKQRHYFAYMDQHGWIDDAIGE